MTVKPEQPLAEIEDAPVIKVAYPSYDEPVGETRTFNWNIALTGLKVLGVLLVLAAYPAMVLMSHEIDDSPIALDDGRYWSAGDVGIAAALITRELDGPGWSADHHRWHPQSRLTALPAWQAGLVDALADHGRLTLSKFQGQRDPDLESAVRLLGRPGDEAVTPRLQAAREALTRYDGRVAVGLAGRPAGPDMLASELTLFAAWADALQRDLASIASPGDGWIASSEAVASVYRAKARAHVAHELLSVRAERDAGLFATAEAQTRFDEANLAWKRAAALGPLFISNQASDAPVGANHVAMMAFLLGEAAIASRTAAEALQAPAAAPDQSIEVTQAD
ncbi:MAG: hypothetical protein AAGJ29_05400 [Pseudomonadota bacterium]